MKKFDLFYNFEISIKRPDSPNGARRELIPNRSLRARLLSQLDCVFACFYLTTGKMLRYASSRIMVVISIPNTLNLRGAHNA